MQTFLYPAVVSEIAPGDFEVRFPDVPEAITGGSSIEAAMREAPDALAAAIEGYLELDRLPPEPGSPPVDVQHVFAVPLDPALAARVALVRAMADQNINLAELARRLGTDWKTVQRIRNGNAASVDKMLGALAAVGLAPALSVQPIFSRDAAEELAWREAYKQVAETITAQQ